MTKLKGWLLLAIQIDSRKRGVRQTSEKGLARYRKGLWAERLAGLWLRLKGYTILDRRVKTPLGEIDLIVRKGSVVAFVEVKARGDLMSAALSVSLSQRSRISRASSLYLARHPQLVDKALRFDVLLVRPWHWPVHILDAWQGDFRLK